MLWIYSPFALLCVCRVRDEAKALPKELFAKAGAAGWLPLCVGSPWPKARLRLQYVCSVQRPAAVQVCIRDDRASMRMRRSQKYVGEPPEELREADYFHELIMCATSASRPALLFSSASG